MDVEEFRRELEDEVRHLGLENGTGLTVTFAEKIVAMLRDAEYLNGEFQESYFGGTHPKRRSNLKIDGWLIDEADETINLFAVHFAEDDSNLTKTQAETSFKMIAAFVDAVLNADLDIEPSRAAFEIAEHIRKTRGEHPKYKFVLLTNARRSLTLNELKNFSIDGALAECQVWDIERIFDIYSSLQVREEITIDFTEYGEGIPCLPAAEAADAYESFLCVISGNVLADIYDRYGSRLLEGNVRSFLSTKRAVNKKIRATILNEPGMFFAFNNGIAVTVKSLIVKQTPRGMFITSAVDFQIINGGQTTASLSSAKFRDKASLDNIFVQMKLTKIGDMEADRQDELIGNISRSSNSQNKVSEADFFSTHPFHVEMEKISRRVSAPAIGGIQQTRWFYERARGQYLQEQMQLNSREKKKFQALNPNRQVITKTDLAKYRMSWDELPHIVSKGAQMNFTAFAELIGAEWKRKPEQFNEHYFRDSVSLAIMFKALEKLVSRQPWYNSYRANIVTYSIALFRHALKNKFSEAELNLNIIWNRQSLPTELESIFETITRQANEFITRADRPIVNVTQWCKQKACRDNMFREVSIELPDALSDFMIDKQTLLSRRKESARDQKISIGLDIQTKIVSLDAGQWENIFREAERRNMIRSPKELSALKTAMKIPQKLPSPAQCALLINLLERLNNEGYSPAPSNDRSKGDGRDVGQRRAEILHSRARTQGR